MEYKITIKNRKLNDWNKKGSKETHIKFLKNLNESLIENFNYDSIKFLKNKEQIISKIYVLIVRDISEEIAKIILEFFCNVSLNWRD